MKSFLVRLSGTGLVVMFILVLGVSGCTKVKKWTGMSSQDEEEIAKEAKEAGGSAGGRSAGVQRNRWVTPSS